MSASLENSEVRRIAIAILHYLRDHPSAKDSTDGIARWWVDADKSLVAQGLAFLVQEGIVARRGANYGLASPHDPKTQQEQVEKTLRALAQDQV